MLVEENSSNRDVCRGIRSPVSIRIDVRCHVFVSPVRVICAHIAESHDIAVAVEFAETGNKVGVGIAVGCSSRPRVWVDNDLPLDFGVLRDECEYTVPCYRFITWIDFGQVSISSKA